MGLVAGGAPARALRMRPPVCHRRGAFGNMALVSARPDTTPNSEQPPSVSVIIPARNAASSISTALDSALAQDYAGPLEVIVADGSDSPSMAELVRQRYPSVRLVPNPQQTTPNGLNAAIGVAAGEIIVRCDCQSILPRDYVWRAVATLAETGAAVVGGRQQPIGDATFERAVGMAITTPLGAGDARYRLGGPEGPVDTVYLGAFRRDALELVGGYDPALTRNQDAEINWRLRRHGKTVWFNPAMVVFYRPRDNVRSLARQYFDYGRWKPVALKRNLIELRARHLAPPLLVAGLVASALLGLSGHSGAALAAPLLYAAFLSLGSAIVGWRRRDAAAFLLPLVLVAMHLSWGIGFFLSARPADPSKGGMGSRAAEKS